MGACPPGAVFVTFSEMFPGCWVSVWGTHLLWLCDATEEFAGLWGQVSRTGKTSVDMQEIIENLG